MPRDRNQLGAAAGAGTELLHFPSQTLAGLIFCHAAQLPLPASLQAAEIPR